FRFKSLIGRFRLSYTEDDRVRETLLPAQPKLWSSLGPFPAEDVVKAYGTAFDPEKDIKGEPLDLKKSYTKVVLPPPEAKGPAGGKEPEKAPPPKLKDEAKKEEPKKEEPEKAERKPAEGKDATKKEDAKKEEAKKEEAKADAKKAK